jgi:hypothetical protein
MIIADLDLVSPIDTRPGDLLVMLGREHPDRPRCDHRIELSRETIDKVLGSDEHMVFIEIAGTGRSLRLRDPWSPDTDAGAWFIGRRR